jgi:hypothetical protein
MAEEHLDTRLLERLSEQSQDLNSDALRITRSALGDYEQEAMNAMGTNAMAVTALATTSDDIMALQTAASIENLAVSVYKTAATLPFIKNGNKVVSTFIAMTTAQHVAHGQAFNAAATAAGGKAQTAPDPKYAAIVKQALPSIKNSADVVKLAITLEDVAAQTYVSYVGKVDNAQLRRLFASVAPVEAQHRATLLAVQALLANGDANLIAIPTDVAKLPAAAGSVGFPNAFYPTKNASPISEGAVK